MSAILLNVQMQHMKLVSTIPKESLRMLNRKRSRFWQSLFIALGRAGKRWDLLAGQNDCRKACLLLW